jgi:formate hydrogenlyase transcriptional activator
MGTTFNSQAEQCAKASEAGLDGEKELRELVDAVPQHIVVISGDGRRLHANQIVLDYHGLTLEEFLAEDAPIKCFHPEDLQKFGALRKSGMASGAPWEAEIRLRRKDGQFRWFLMRVKPLRDEQGHVVRWYAAGTDIEDRKQTEAELRQLVDAVPQHIVVLDGDGRRLHANQVVLDYHGLTLEEFLVIDESKCFHTEDLQNYARLRQSAIATGKPWEAEIRLHRKDGEYRWFLMRSKALRDDQGRIIRWYLARTDVEERHQSRAALESAFEEIKKLKEELFRENLALKEEIDQASLFEEIVGSSEPLRRVLMQVTKVAPTDSTVLIAGETGTGKELVARAIHKRSQRSARAFISVNCAAIPAALIGSELFGHEKGAFTGATQRRLGRFELAEGGTLFLDEVGDLPAETQIALLRVLQEHRFERIGGNQSITANVRIIAATNRDLQAAIQAGTFRSDLFYRLNVFPIDIPPLRERREDIPLLVEYLIERYANKAGKKIKKIDKTTMGLFQTYHWPGNIRELQNVIERAVILCDGESLSVEEVWLQSESQHAHAPAKGLGRLGARREREMIESALAETHGRIAGPNGAAAKLGIPRSTLETKIRSLRINKHRFKSQ